MTGDILSDASIADALPFVSGSVRSNSSQSLPKRRRQCLRSSRSSTLRKSSAQTLFHLRNNSTDAFRSGSPSDLRGKRSLSSIPGLPSPEASENESPNAFNASIQTRDFSSVLPTPPESEDDEAHASPSETAPSCSQATFPFPLQPADLPLTSNNRSSRTPFRRRYSPKTRQSTASPSPDRFISSRSTPMTPQSPAETFHVSKTPEQLSPNERLFRHGSATPDPFGPLRVARIRAERISSHIGRASQGNRRPRSRTIGLTHVSDLPPDPSGAQNRQASPGNIWNIGGTSQADIQAPIRGVSNGRGGFISSGSNAPMYESQFLDDLSTDQDVDQMERRLAAALDIDQARRVLNNSKVQENLRIASTGSIGIKRKRLYLEPQTSWNENGWIQDSVTEGESRNLMKPSQSLRVLSHFWIRPLTYD